ncbi:MAG: class I SAM-dependent methyltransferase [Ornithinimicrobium sp.]
MTGDVSFSPEQSRVSSGPTKAERLVTPLGIIADRIDSVHARLTQYEGDLVQSGGTALDAGIWADLETARAVAGGLDPYLQACTTPESEALRGVAEQTRAMVPRDRPSPSAASALTAVMLSGHVEGQVLAMLVHATKAERVLEIGMFTGYSALAMAEALPSHGQLVACEIDPQIAAVAQGHFDQAGYGKAIEVRVGPALETLEQLAADGAEPFDLIFLDADKPGYSAYVDALLHTELWSRDGLLCVDNTLLEGQAYGAGEVSANGAAIADFNERVFLDPLLEQVMLPLRDGLTLIRRVHSGAASPLAQTEGE